MIAFTERHERELADIKALTDQLDRRVRESLEQLERIEQTQDEALRRAGRPPVEAMHLAPGDGRDPLLAFVHIPKTAGGTAISMLSAAYSKEAVKDAGNYFRNPEYISTKLSRNKKTSGRVLAGHVPYGVFREFLPADTRYMVFLREPVDRVLSHYWRHIRRKDPRHAGRVKARPGARVKAESLEAGIVDMRLAPLNNFQTRFLCTDPPPSSEELPASALDEAKANLHNFAFLGIQERFEESLILLQRELELGAVPYEDRHVSADRPTVEQLPEEERALIEEHNRLDAELYRYGLELFEEAVAGAGEEFAADVEALRVQSPAVREEAWRRAREAHGTGHQ